MQAAIGSDVMMVLDQFPGYPAKERDVAESVEATTRWATRSLAAFQKKRLGKKSQLFAIVQGSTYPAYREKSAEALTNLPFDGFAIGGLAVGEPKLDLYRMIETTIPFLPEDKPRYAMGVGAPEDIIEAVKCGVDMFDCVIPTREARHGRVYFWKKRPSGPAIWKPAGLYDAYSIKGASTRGAQKPLSPHCQCYSCTNYTQSYIHHLFHVKESLAQTLLSIHNITFYQDLVAALRNDILKQ
jgi:queuine tRNA-ribosyltransferase